jgi:hypothetical protein
MELRAAMYELEPILDDPRYEGFGVRGFPKTLPPNRTSRNWRVIRLAPNWLPFEANGRVRKFNDYPCVNLMNPAFSQKAVDALRGFLEPNGEILPLVSSVGSYFAYNVTKIAAVLDPKRSKINWLKKDITAFEVERYELLTERLDGLSIFRIPENPTSTYVTEPFVARAQEHGLRGMNFIKVWPLPPGVYWRALENERRQKRHTEGLPAGQSVKGNSVVIRLQLGSPKSTGTEAEKKSVNKLMDQLDAQLVDVNSDAPVVGSLEGFDYGVPGECRLFLSCPDADALVKKLHPWLKAVDWPKGFKVLKRYGNFADKDAREERAVV